MNINRSPLLLAIALWTLPSSLLIAQTVENVRPAHANDALTSIPHQPAGDGVADDTMAIQAAVDRSTGSLRFAPGVYRLTRPIVIDLDRVGWTSLHGDGVVRFVMTGPGPAIQITGTHDGTASPSTVRPGVWDRQRAPLIDGIEIVGKHPKADGIEASGTMQLTMTRLVVRKSRHAVRLTGRNRNVTIGQCHLYENAGVGVLMEDLNLHQINIANCHISYNHGGGVVSRRSEIRNLQIGTCDIEGNHSGDGSPATANILLNSNDGSVAEVAIVGCTIQHTHEATDSANIRITGIPEPRSFTQDRRVGNITIANNVLSDVQFNIDLQDVRGITISGNTMWKGYEANLRAKNCREIALSANLYDRNPQYHYGDGADAKLGMILEGCRNLTINGEVFQGIVHRDAAVRLTDCEGVSISGCVLANFNRAAFQMKRLRFSSISNCVMSGQGVESVAFEQVGENDVALHNNRFRKLTREDTNDKTDDRQ
ncbi:right-handed parallel beta-helix repeat-containing protein [Crateriforma conspicua]|uniref:Pectate lyase superfamily protein n=1 Tax=Crateriforma conspicua TaxID=2527996 RepID=A0A5C5Y7W6_9PLAN|nr:right-handed parallel beta-helix repeat-containing protein [Crateriforma conspicua]TWT71410.1 Pectate lyase superfamily protein [Crateriforma conspicua]